MQENAKKFLELVSKDEALKAELTQALIEAAKGKEGKEAQLEAAAEASAKVAAAHGHNIPVEDFKAPKMYVLSEDELKTVAGGMNFNPQKITSTCSCTGGNGTGDTWELYCYCMQSGEGVNTNNNHWRCGCSGGNGLGAA